MPSTSSPPRPETPEEQQRQQDALRKIAAAVEAKRTEKQQTGAPDTGGAR